MIIVLSGGFDPVHVGHIRMFEKGKKLGTVIVGLNSDDWLTRKKGKPFMPWEERKDILESIKFIDKVCVFDDTDNSCCELIKDIVNLYGKENIVVGNGGDRIETNTSVEYEYCKENNIEMVWGLGGGKIQSSSWLIGGEKNE